MFDVHFEPTLADAGMVYMVMFSGYNSTCTTTVHVMYHVDASLPVELSSFASAISGNNVTLNWTTASEMNNSGFDIERSSSDNEWTKAGNVSGIGNSNSPHLYTFADRGLSAGSYKYRLKQIDYNGNFEYFNLTNDVNIGMPNNFSLSQNYPNPFNPSTTISFAIPKEGFATLTVYDNSGKEVATLINEFKTAGYHTTNFSASSLASGAYFYKLEVKDENSFVQVRKMIVLK